MAAKKSNAIAKSPKSNRGGIRPGAGRKPAIGKSVAAKHRALMQAIDNLEATAENKFHADLAFFIAMNCLAADADVAVAALGISKVEFCERFGPAFLAWAVAHRPMRR